jgi:ABC-2 type transport system permease protein
MVKMNLLSVLEYRAAFFTQFFGMIISNSAFLFFWWITFFQIDGRIAGYDFQDIVFIWAVTSTGFGIAHILCDNTVNITKLIITGELDMYLLQPGNILVNVLCCKTSLSAFGDFLYGIILMCLFYLINLKAWFWFLCGSILCALVFTSVLLFANTLTFYIGDASLIAQFFTEFLVSFSTYPEKIYGPFVRVLMYSALPAGIAVHIPLKMFHLMNIKVFILAFLWVVLYCIFTAVFFYKGLKRYESGNMISTRI